MKIENFVKTKNFVKKIILSSFIFGLTFNANAAETIGEAAKLRDQRRGQLEERFEKSEQKQKEIVGQDDATKFETNARSNDMPPSTHFEGWNKLSGEEKTEVKKHHDELRGSKEKAPVFERKAAEKTEPKKVQ